MPDFSPQDASIDTPSTPRSRRIRAEAAVWVVRLDAGKATRDDARLARWCKRSPDHQAAFSAAVAHWQNADTLRARAPVRQRAPVPLARPARAPFWRLPFGAPRAVFASVCLAAGVGLGAALWLHTPGITTGSGEMRTVALDDGSTVRLDADSAVAIHYSPQERGVVLVRGRAAFDVSHGDARRFVVHAGDGEIVDIGTAFQVSTTPLIASRDDHAALVTVTQGRVKVINDAVSVEVTAGHSVAYDDAKHAPAHANVDLFAATAWQRGRMVFSEAPLADVVTALNRYWPGHFLYVRGSAAALRVSGNFATAAPAAAVATLAETLRLHATQIAGRIVILSAGNAPSP